MLSRFWWSHFPDSQWSFTHSVTLTFCKFMMDLVPRRTWLASTVAPSRPMAATSTAPTTSCTSGSSLMLLLPVMASLCSGPRLTQVGLFGWRHTGVVDKLECLLLFCCCSSSFLGGGWVGGGVCFVNNALSETLTEDEFRTKDQPDRSLFS